MTEETEEEEEYDEEDHLNHLIAKVRLEVLEASNRWPETEAILTRIEEKLDRIEKKLDRMYFVEDPLNASSTRISDSE